MERGMRTMVMGALLLVFAMGCRKEKDPSPGGNVGFSGTPVELDLPSWVMDSIGIPAWPPDNPLTVEGVALGRKLFHEKALSDNYTQSCASCHVQEHAFTDPDPFSEGTNGAFGDRNAMAVINLAWDLRFFWDGRRNTLEGQAHDPVTNPIEMRNTWPEVEARLQAHPEYPSLFEAAFGTSTIDSNLVVKAIAQFERTLLSFNSRYDRFYYGGDSTALTEQEKHGMDLFFRDAHCVDCHREHTFSDPGMRNNGLDLSPQDSGFYLVTGVNAHIGRFKVPTLRNIGVTGPYMHDSRFATLEEVVDFYADDVELNSPNLDAHMFPWVAGHIDLDATEREALVAFMHALTDDDFLNDPRFSAP
ncbi:MAG: cytochrome-c peroxidase [Flavobacteriales bacterium]|nr:cytochrome-c peroxidase [Flavobacteriales bacterium]